MHLYIKSLPFSLLKREIYIFEGLCTVCVTYLSPLKVKRLRGKQRGNGVKISRAEVSPARPRTTHAMPLYLDRRTPAGDVCQHVARPTHGAWGGEGIFLRPFFSFGNINNIRRISLCLLRRRRGRAACPSLQGHPSPPPVSTPAAPPVNTRYSALLTN